ncbi:metallophosphoesterase [Chitinophaga alhagiae]|uniref:metallophosphoesterase n=1 Tax=Chitinophaga alhagiae TaxID=2203219 RepID=UPI000E5A6BDD|nr:metallophosphoesterase [Chitinophaga alhagiae]
MKRLLQYLFRKPVIWLANKFSSRPQSRLVFSALSQLQEDILNNKKEKGLLLSCTPENARFVIFSDQHKGGGDAADDFVPAADNYHKALTWYYGEGYTLVNLGDCEELWESTPSQVIAQHRLSLLEEAKFLQQKRYYRIFGNHDLEWNYVIPRNQFLKPIFGNSLKVYEGLLVEIPYNKNLYRLLLTHGHQGDRHSDGNAFSKWFVAAIWTPAQRFLDIRINTVSDSFDLVDLHNIVLYEWTLQQPRTILVTGHTHKPVFASLDHIDRLTKQLERAVQEQHTELAARLQADLAKRQAEYAGKQIVKTMARPAYFNTGCCCFSDGDITGLEISEGFIRLIKWEGGERKVLEESPLYYLFEQL